MLGQEKCQEKVKCYRWSAVTSTTSGVCVRSARCLLAGVSYPSPSRTPCRRSYRHRRQYRGWWWAPARPPGGCSPVQSWP